MTTTRNHMRNDDSIGERLDALRASYQRGEISRERWERRREQVLASPTDKITCPRCGDYARVSKTGPHKGMFCEDCALAEAHGLTEEGR